MPLTLEVADVPPDWGVRIDKNTYPRGLWLTLGDRHDLLHHGGAEHEAIRRTQDADHRQ